MGQVGFLGVAEYLLVLQMGGGLFQCEGCSGIYLMLVWFFSTQLGVYEKCIVVFVGCSRFLGLRVLFLGALRLWYGLSCFIVKQLDFSEDVRFLVFGGSIFYLLLKVFFFIYLIFTEVFGGSVVLFGGVRLAVMVGEDGIIRQYKILVIDILYSGFYRKFGVRYEVLVVFYVFRVMVGSYYGQQVMGGSRLSRV